MLSIRGVLIHSIPLLTACADGAQRPMHEAQDGVADLSVAAAMEQPYVALQNKGNRSMKIQHKIIRRQAEVARAKAIRSFVLGLFQGGRSVGAANQA